MSRNYQRPVVVRVRLDYDKDPGIIAYVASFPPNPDWCPPMMATLIWSFLIYLLIQYFVSYIMVDYGQKYLYDEATPNAALKVAIGATILAALLTYTKSNFATMFTSDIRFTVLLAIAWVGVYILLFQFHPWHGFGLAMATLLIFAGLSTLVVDSLTAPKPAGRIDTSKPIQTIRGSMSGPTIVRPTETPAQK